MVGRFQQWICRIVMLMVWIGLQACSNESSSPGKIIKIEPQAFTNTLYYTGTILPLKTQVIASPADGLVMDMPRQYGQFVEKGQPIFTLSSTKFLTDYKTALMGYIKAKNEFENGTTQFKESQFLHQHQLISDDDYRTKQSNYYAAQLSLMEAKDNLDIFLRQIGHQALDIYHLKMTDIAKINDALHLKVNAETIQLLAPTAGILLVPLKTDEAKKIVKGDMVKQGDVLAVIGDMSGISIEVKVNELTVNQLKAGQRVEVTGVAFPDATLVGSIQYVDKQGEQVSGSAPVFAVAIEVPALTKSQQDEIHAGMSANVKIDLNEKPSLLIPLAALKEKSGNTYVDRYDARTKHLQTVAVQTGKSTLDAVAILSGLKAGDDIVVPD